LAAHRPTVTEGQLSNPYRGLLAANKDFLALWKDADPPEASQSKGCEAAIPPSSSMIDLPLLPDLPFLPCVNTRSRVEDIAEQPEEKRSTNEAYRVLYDGQCEVCQSCVSWLRTLDHESKAICLPISAEVLSAVDSRLQMDQCLRQLHVVTPEGQIHVGWDAVACLARLFPST